MNENEALKKKKTNAQALINVYKVIIFVFLILDDITTVDR